MAKSIRGSKKLGQWVESDAVEIIQRIDNGKRQKDAAIVMRIKRSGKVCLVVTRKHCESFRSGHASISKARREKEETWGVDGHILTKCRAHKPDFVVIFLTDTEDYWVSNFSAWLDPKTRIRRVSKYRSDPIYHLPSHFMKHVPNKVTLHSPKL